MKAILHNREDDLHFLLKCLIEELQDNSILKVAQKDMPKDKLARDRNIDDAERKLVELGALPDLDYKRGKRATGKPSRATKKYAKKKRAMELLLDLASNKEKRNSVSRNLIN